MKKINLFTYVFLFLGILAGKAQIIATYAGNGTAGYSGDGGAATSAELHAPGGLIYFSGNLYISDLDNNRIRMVNASGTISTFAGNGTAGYSGDGDAATSAEINTPKGLAVDASGNIYIADEANNRIRKVNTSGIISTVAGNGTAGYSGDGGAATSAEINSPYGVAIDASGNLYIADEANNRIRMVNTSGTISTIAGNGTAGFSGDGGAATSAELKHPINVSVDAAGNIYIVDYGNSRIRMLNTSGTISTIVGNGTAGFSGDGGAATSAEIDMTTGIAKMDGSGNLYIADDGNNRIRMVNASGVINTVAGNGTASYSGDGGLATSAEFNSPNHIEFDNVGNYYIADGANNRIREVYLPLSVSSTVITNVTCHGGNNGGILASPSGGTVPYTYLWSNSTTGDTNGGLSIGTYSITVTDHYGVTATASSAITQPTALSVSASVTTNVSCNTENNGSASATPSGGISPYTYLWSNSESTGTISGLSAGTYWVTILANNGCLDTISASITITQPMALRDSIVSSTNTCPQNINGTTTVGVKYGTSPYTYSWIPGGQTTATVSGLSAGYYTVVITDHHSCSDSLPDTISTITGTTITARPGFITCPGINDTLNASTATSYAWSTGATTSRIIVSPSTSTTYTLESVNSGCHDTIKYSVLTDCGNSCSNSFALTPFYTVDSLAANASKWYSFVDTASTLPIIVKSLTGSAGNIHKIVLYGSCGGSIIAQDSASGLSDSLGIIASSLTTGNTYYVLVDNSVPGCPSCSHKTEYTLTSRITSYLWQNLYYYSGCGLNYKFSSIALHGRDNPSEPICGTPNVSTGVPYNSSWGTFTISGIPVGSIPVEAILLYSVIDPNYQPLSNLPTTYQFRNNILPTPTTYTLTSTAIGAESVEGPTCNHAPFTANNGGSTWSFETIIPASDINGNGNGTYQIVPGTLPYYPTVTSNEDIDGATLILIYTDANPNYIGTLQINGGLIWGNCYNPNFNDVADHYSMVLNANIPAGVGTQNTFFIVDDIENCGTDFCAMGSNYYDFDQHNSPASMFMPQDWNTVEYKSTYPAGTYAETYEIDESNGGGDCYDLVATGAYYQVTNHPDVSGITATPSGATCPGSSVYLQVPDPLPGSTYTWSNGETGTGIYVFPTNCFQAYTVTVTNGTCKYYGTYTTDVMEPQITALNSPVCAVNPTFTGYVNKGGDIGWVAQYAYVLSFNASILCDGCGSPIYTFSTSDPSLQTKLLNGGATLQVNVPVGGADQDGFTVYLTATCNGVSCSTSLFEPGCCGEDAGTDCAWVNPDLINNVSNLYRINTGTFYHFVDSTGGYYIEDVDNTPSGDCYSLTIDGTFNVDQNLTIKNSSIFMGARAKIVLSNGANLTIKNSYIRPCGSMWDAIYVPYGSSLTVEDGSLIEGADTAIVSSSGSQFTIENSTLNANYKGIVVEPVNWADGGPVIEGSQISCNNYMYPTMLPPNNHGTNVALASTVKYLDAPYGSYYNWESEIGIELDNVYSINIGNTGSVGDNNLFENQFYGIYSRASSVNIYNNTFNDITGCAGCYNLSTPSNPSSAIIAMGDPTGSYTVNIGGTGTNQSNTFENSTVGIIERDTLNFNIKNNQFNYDNMGVFAESNYKNTININSNNMTHMGGGSPFTVVTTGILTSGNAQCGTEIETNTITCAPNYSYGIRAEEFVLNTKTRYTIKNNNISGTEYGISAGGFQGGYIENNTVTTNSYKSSGSNEGVDLWWGVGTIVTTNTVTGQGNGDGIRLDDTYGSNTTYSLTVSCNNISDCFYDMYFSGAQLNDLIDRNEMYSYSSSSNSSGLYLYNNANIPTQGSNTHGTNNTWNYHDNLSSQPWSINNTSPNQLTFWVNDPTAGTPGYPDNISSHVRLSPTTGTDCYVCSGFPPCTMTSCNTCTIGVATAIIKGHNPYSVYSTASHWLEKFELYSSVLSNDTDYIDSSTMALDATVHTFMDSVASTNMGYIYTLLNNLGDTNGVSLADVTNANSMLSSISSPDTVESTFKQVYQIYANMLSNGLSVPNSTELPTLQGIAPLCPAQYGPAVYAARAILAPIDTTLYVSTCELLPDSTSRDFHKLSKRVDSTTTPVSPLVTVYPNPANTELNIQIITGQAGQGINDYFYLYDNMGQLIERYPLTNSLTTLALTRVADGIYYYRIVDSKQQALKTDKLLIIR